MKKIMVSVLFLLLVCLTGVVTAQTPEPTQTPYIIYVVVTATPEPVVEMPVVESPVVDAPVIARPTAVEPITLMNQNQSSGNSANTSGDGEVTIVNQTGYAASVDELVQRVVSTVVAGTSTSAGGTDSSYSGTGGALVHLSDGTTCTMNFQLVSEPTFPAGSIIPRGEVFWKEWEIQNTGSCTWTPEWEFVFDSGWQIGNTRFHMNRTTAPGQTLNVRLAMVPDQREDGNYYSTYVFEAPDGTRYGTITSSYTVKPFSYFVKPTPDPRYKNKPDRCPDPWGCLPPCPPPYPYWWW